MQSTLTKREVEEAVIAPGQQPSVAESAYAVLLACVAQARSAYKLTKLIIM